MGYATLKLIHISAVTVSFLGFAARGLGKSPREALIWLQNIAAEGGE